MSLISRLIPAFVAQELNRPTTESTYFTVEIDALRETADTDESRAMCVVYAEERVTAELDNMIDVLQDDDMSSAERQIAAVDLVARTLVLADAVGVDPIFFASTIDTAINQATDELHEIVEVGPSREAAGLYNVEEDKPVFNRDEKKPWNVGNDDKLKEL